jgi:formylglycine-generating enzyme required for sulfatase activity
MILTIRWGVTIAMLSMTAATAAAQKTPLPQFQPSVTGPVTVRLNQKPEEMYAILGEMGGFRVTFDSSFPSMPPFPFGVERAGIVDALDILSFQAGTFWQAIDDHSILVALDNPTGRRKVRPRIQKTIELKTLQSKAAIDALAAVLRLWLEEVDIDAPTRTLVVRDIVDQVGLAEAIVADYDRAAAPPAFPEPSSRFPEVEFAGIAAGNFLMGCSAGDRACLGDQPAHRVTISQGFELGKYEVTQAQWRTAMGSNPSHFKGDTLPVENVSWIDAQEFLHRLNARNDGYRYRLPTEAEWEYAARAGSTDGFPGEPDALGWHAENSGRAALSGTLDAGSYPSPRRLLENGNQTHPVGGKRPNAWGLHDMSGNVAEWVQDWLGDDGDLSSPEVDPQGPSGPSSWMRKASRGGSWNSVALYARVSFRCRDCASAPTARSNSTGFRVLREAQ